MYDHVARVDSQDATYIQYWCKMRSSRAMWIVFVIKFDFLLSVLGSRHCACQHLTLPAGPESLHRHTVHQACPYTYSHSWFNSQRRPVSPPSYYLGTLFIKKLTSGCETGVPGWLSSSVRLLTQQDLCTQTSGSNLPGEVKRS